MREGNHMRAVLIIVIENCRNQTINGYLQSLYQEKSAGLFQEQLFYVSD